MYRVPLCIGVLGLAAAFAAAQESGLGRGSEILAPFKRDLLQALNSGLAQGPVQAIAACRIEAPQIAASLSQNGVLVGRASQRLRNPANAAPGWVAPILEAYANDRSNRAPVAVPLEGDRTGYVEPIIVQPLCVTCHGDNLAPEVAARISELYPSDRAIGYRVGDLRGVFWAEFPRSGQGASVRESGPF